MWKLLSFFFLLSTANGFVTQTRRLTRTALQAATGVRAAQELIQSLVVDDQCFSTESGARAFGDSCAFDIVYEDCFEPQPVVGKTVSPGL